MRKVIKLFFNIRTELQWLSQQKGFKLVQTNRFTYTFEESSADYNYEYVFFEKNKNELNFISNQIIDKDIELVCISSSWALFRKDISNGEIHVLADNYIPYKNLMRKYTTYMSLGSCYLCLGSANIALMYTNQLFSISSALFYICSCIFYFNASAMKKYASGYDDGSYKERLKRDKC